MQAFFIVALKMRKTIGEAYLLSYSKDYVLPSVCVKKGAKK